MPVGAPAKAAAIQKYAPTSSSSSSSSLGNAQRTQYTRGGDYGSSLGNSGR